MAYGLRKKEKIVLGKSDYIKCKMDVKLREEHMHVIGAPGSGKSRFLLSLIQQDLQENRGFCVIDPHGELVDHVKDWLAKHERTVRRRKVHILDFNDIDCQSQSKKGPNRGVKVGH